MSRLLKFCCLLLIVLVPRYSCAQGRDTAYCAETHTFHLTGLIAPTTLIGLGSLGTFTPYLHDKNVVLRDWVQSDNHNKLHFDDYVQYAPAASIYALKLCGLESKHNYRDITNLMAATYITTAILNLSTKWTFDFERPNGGGLSFPSGHTATAFAGAEMLRREYGEEYPLVGIAGYVVATSVGCMRIYNNAHWAADVLAGAGIGILSASIAYWLAPYLRF